MAAKVRSIMNKTLFSLDFDGKGIKTLFKTGKISVYILRVNIVGSGNYDIGCANSVEVSDPVGAEVMARMSDGDITWMAHFQDVNTMYTMFSSVFPSPLMIGENRDIYLRQNKPGAKSRVTIVIGKSLWA